MLKIWLQAFREQARLIAQNPAAAYGAAMTAVVVALMAYGYKITNVALERGNMIITREVAHSQVVTDLGQAYMRLQDDAHGFKDSAFYWQIKYEMLQQSSKK